MDLNEKELLALQHALSIYLQNRLSDGEEVDDNYRSAYFKISTEASKIGMKHYSFVVQTKDGTFHFTIKSAENEAMAWHLVEKQFDDVIGIELIKEEEK